MHLLGINLFTIKNNKKKYYCPYPFILGAVLPVCCMIIHTLTYMTVIIVSCVIHKDREKKTKYQHFQLWLNTFKTRHSLVNTFQESWGLILHNIRYFYCNILLFSPSIYENRQITFAFVGFLQIFQYTEQGSNTSVISQVKYSRINKTCSLSTFYLILLWNKYRFWR